MLVMSDGLGPVAAVPIRLPGTGMTLHENTSDALTLKSYIAGKTSYLRKADGVFAKLAAYSEVTVSPAGDRAAAVPKLYTAAGGDSVVVIDRKTGKKTATIGTVKKPLATSYGYWHRGGRLLVLTVERKAARKWGTVGFTVVDTVARTARTVNVAGVDPAATFQWAPDGRQLVATYKSGTRFYGTDGSVKRTLTQAGRPTGAEDAFSPSGNRLMTWCPTGIREHVCLVDSASGKVATRVPGVTPETMWGWWNDGHLVGVLAKRGAYQAVVVSTNGKVVRVLADIPAADWKRSPYLSFTLRQSQGV